MTVTDIFAHPRAALDALIEPLSISPDPVRSNEHRRVADLVDLGSTPEDHQTYCRLAALGLAKSLADWEESPVDVLRDYANGFPAGLFSQTPRREDAIAREISRDARRPNSNTLANLHALWDDAQTVLRWTEDQDGLCAVDIDRPRRTDSEPCPDCLGIVSSDLYETAGRLLDELPIDVQRRIGWSS